MKVITAHLRSDKDFILAYLTLLMGLMRLTETELKVLAELVWEHRKMFQAKVLEPALGSHIFNSETKNNIRERLSQDKPISPQHFNNIMKSLRDKGAIVESKDSGLGYSLDERILPETEVTFKYVIQ